MRELLLLNPEKARDEEVLQYSIREAARAVVHDVERNVALLHVSRDAYYKLPGGGIDEGESRESALARECQEEIGSEIEVLQELGIVTEYRKFVNLKQISYCYLARSVGRPHLPQFTDHEKERGFQPPTWVTYTHALRLLEESRPATHEGREYIIPRDIALLKAAQKYL